MAQLLIRQIDDEDIAQLKARAKALRTSVEALAREAIRKEAKLTAQERLSLVRAAQAETASLMVPGAKQTPGWALIREGRDER